LKNKRSPDAELALSKLREAAEKAISYAQTNADELLGRDIDQVFQELQVYQVELEMQNDELYRANEQLEEERIRFSRIYNLAPVGYFILNRNGIIEDVNQTATTLLETDKASIISNRLYNFVSPSYSDQYYQFYQKMLSSETSQNCQLQLISSGGRQLYAHVEGIAIQASLTQQTNYYVAIIDISERIAVMQDLAETKERLELALTASSAGTWQLNLQDMSFYLDELNSSLCFVKGNKLEGSYEDFLAIVHQEDQLKVDQHFRHAIGNNKDIDIVCRITKAGGQSCYAAIHGRSVPIPRQGTRLVGIMLDVSEKILLEQETDKLKQNHQKNVTFATLNAEENERKRISELLHDSVSQLLYAINIKVDHLNAEENQTTAIKDIKKLLNQAIRDTRNISFELAPSILVDFGLPATLENLTFRLTSDDLQLKTEVVGFENRMDLRMESSIFRIIQELINNCIKHASASEINLYVKKSDTIEIVVRDNGRGFDINAQEISPKGSGLSSIKNRISLYNGFLTINSKPGIGTTVHILLRP
jgi:PAS domain S-box-containing protein